MENVLGAVAACEAGWGKPIYVYFIWVFDARLSRSDRCAVLN